MMAQTKQTAWNGVRFRMPATWEISRMGRQYLQMEDDDGPVFEMKWHFVQGRFSHAAHLKKLASRPWFDKRARVEACDMPGHWAGAVERYAAQAFRWQGPQLEGMGAILYCEDCRTAHLLQFLRRDIVDNHRLCQGLLSSLRDHPSARHNGNQPWAVYDLRAEIPCAYRLREYRFSPGAFALEFDGADRSQLSLYRWGPASLLLAKQRLEQFVRGQVPWAQSAQDGHTIQEQDFIHVERSDPTPAWSHWLGRLRRRPLFYWLHAWHDAAHNRILAVNASGVAPLPRDVLQLVSDRYVMA